jgi:hypothetical protein
MELKSCIDDDSSNSNDEEDEATFGLVDAAGGWEAMLDR